MGRLGLGLGLGTALTAARSGGGVAPVAVTWDPASLNAHSSLSNGDLTVTTTYYSNSTGAKSTTSKNSGKVALKFTAVLTAGDPANEEVSVGFCDAAFDTTADVYMTTRAPGSIGVFVMNDGQVAESENAYSSLLSQTPSGGSLFLLLDIDAGKVWVGNSVDGMLGNPEAGTGASYTFTPGTAIKAVTQNYCNPGNSVSVTWDPTYSSGTFAAWS